MTPQTIIHFFCHRRFRCHDSILPCGANTLGQVCQVVTAKNLGRRERVFKSTLSVVWPSRHRKDTCATIKLVTGKEVKYPSLFWLFARQARIFHKVRLSGPIKKPKRGGRGRERAIHHSTVLFFSGALFFCQLAVFKLWGKLLC